MQEQDASVFSKVMGKVSGEFLTRLFSKQEIYQAFLGLIRSKPDVDLIYDQARNTWYIGGSWDAICLIRQQMIVLIDCVFTFQNILPCSHELNKTLLSKTANGKEIPHQMNSQNDIEITEKNCLFDQSIIGHISSSKEHLSQNHSTQIQEQPKDGPSLIFHQMSFSEVIPKRNMGDGIMKPRLHNVIGPSAPMDDSNASLIEKLENLNNTKLSQDQSFPNNLSNSLTLDSDNEEDLNGVITSDASQALTSAILDLSRKVDAVTVNESIVGVPSDNSVGVHDSDLRFIQGISQDMKQESKCLRVTAKKSIGKLSSSNTCTICSKTFLNKSNMVRHARSIHKIADFNHPGTPSVTEFTSKNLNDSAQESGRWNCRQSKDSVENRSCKFCLKVFSTRSNLYKHSRKCKQAHECDTCHEKFESHDVLCHHVYKIHSLFLCRMCDKIVDSAENYADHVNFCHPNYSLDDVVVATTTLSESEGADSSCEDGRGRTGQRNQLFVRSGSCMGALGMGGNRGKQPLRCHRPNPCLKCGKVFSTFSNLLKHIRVIHENARFPCNLCKRVFACKDGLKHHMDKVHNKITYRCEVCSMEFENQLRLAKHLNLIHDQQSTIYNFQCELCGKTFLYKTNLKRHKKLDHEGLRYSCQRCIMSFRSKSQLNEHHRIVHLGLLLKCDTCDRQFNTWTTLRDHERSAHGKHAPIVCVVCGKKFTRYPGLSYHLRKHHKRKYNVAGEISASHTVDEKKVAANGKSKIKGHKLKSTAKISSRESPILSNNDVIEATQVLPTCPDNSQNNEAINNIPDYSLTNSAYVPSFYDQHFQLPDVLTIQKDLDADICNREVMTQLHLPAFNARFGPGSEVSPSPDHGYPAPNFISSSAYGVTQETAILCLSDTINFYDNLSLSPEQQNDSVVSDTFSTEGFITFSNNSDL